MNQATEVLINALWHVSLFVLVMGSYIAFFERVNRTYKRTGRLRTLEWIRRCLAYEIEEDMPPK